MRICMSMATLAEAARVSGTTISVGTTRAPAAGVVESGASRIGKARAGNCGGCVEDPLTHVSGCHARLGYARPLSDDHVQFASDFLGGRLAADTRPGAQGTSMTYIVEAVDEALGLLMLVAEHPSLGVTELARRAGLTKARAFRLLSTLEHRGLLAREAHAAVYKLGYNALLVGNAAREQIELIKLVAPHLVALGEACGENVIVRVRDGLESVCVARHESSQSVRVHTEVGNRRPLHVGASGKLLLAFAADDVVDAVLARALERFTSTTIVEPDQLREELAAIRAAGYAVSLGERDAEAVSVAAPLRDHSGAAVASLSIASPASRTKPDTIERHIALVVERAAMLSRTLGHARG